MARSVKRLAMEPNMIRLVQLAHTIHGRRLALVDEPNLRLLQYIPIIYDLAHRALASNTPIADLIQSDLTNDLLEYDPIHAGTSDWKILPAIDHPTEPARVSVAGTGLTHLGSAKSRNAMHGNIGGDANATAAPETDSMKMFRWGRERGKPPAGAIGIAPEWFYKGNGTVLRAHNEPLDIPPFGEDGGEEAEIVGLYIIADDGNGGGIPIRVGMAQGNEFSDHIFEKKNYLNLAGSKLRTCSIGPEIVLDPDFSQVPGHGRIMRKSKDGNEDILWSKPLATGEAEMSHSLANLEHHHFKFPAHRRPGDVHVHFFGACALSFTDGMRLQDGDIMHVHFKGFGRPLRNPLRIYSGGDQLVSVKALK